MRPTFNPRLVNGPFGDPALFVAFQHRSRALLFDLGDLTALGPRDALKVSHVFVSHTHMDHFVGFDRLLRLHLRRNRRLHLYGPRGFCDNVAGKLAGYTWNLVGDEDYPLEIEVAELGSTGLTRRRFRCRRRFAPEAPAAGGGSGEVLLEEDGFSVRAAVLDHGIPCLGFALEERFHINIVKARLAALGLAPGPWLNDFKQAVYEGRDPESEVVTAAAAGGRPRRFRLGDLTRQIALITPGQKLAYVTDVADTPENRRRITELAGGCDRLFIEAAFLDADRRLAEARRHLTARQAGQIAAQAGVGQLTTFHFSPRYAPAADRLQAEAQAAFVEAQSAGASPA